VCCRMLQCVAECYSVLQCVVVGQFETPMDATMRMVTFGVAVCCSKLQWVVVCCSVLQCVAVCCSEPIQHADGRGDEDCQIRLLQCAAVCAAVCCSVLKRVAVRYSVLQCVAVC